MEDRRRITRIASHCRAQRNNFFPRQEFRDERPRPTVLEWERSETDDYEHVFAEQSRGFNIFRNIGISISLLHRIDLRFASYFPPSYLTVFRSESAKCSACIDTFCSSRESQRGWFEGGSGEGKGDSLGVAKRRRYLPREPVSAEEAEGGS